MNIPPPESNVSDTTAGKTRYCNMKMPVSSYHGGELHVQNRAQYEYSAPESADKMWRCKQVCLSHSAM